MFCLVFLFLIFGTQCVHSASTVSIDLSHKICVPENVKKTCMEMIAEGVKQNVHLTCIIGRDRLDCLEKLHQHSADFSFMEPEDMYISAGIDNKAYVVLKEIRTKEELENEFRYKGVAVVRKNLNIKSISSLKGLNSCHTGIGRNVGYKIPIVKLMKMKILTQMTDTSISTRESELKALSMFFNKACLVGKWAPDEATNQRLKNQYSNLCALCEHPDICDYPDENSGYEGALNCLTKAGGDIAWTKTVYVEKYFGLKKGEKSQNADNYAYLCPDGNQISLDEPPCTWAARPWPAFLADAQSRDLDTIRDEISKLNKLGEALSSDWFSIVLQLNNKTIAVSSANMLHPYEYLTKAKYYDVIERGVISPRRGIRWCVITEPEHDKCKNLKIAAFSRDIRPEFDCVRESSIEKCLQTISNGGADIITVDAVEAIRAKNMYNTRAVAAENYYKNITDLYAIAVVRKDSPYQSFKDLKGEKSCHSPYSLSAGWITPIFTLLKKGLLTKENCDLAKSFSEFFSGGSCVVESAVDTKDYAKLTSLCGSKTDAGYENYKGPLRCVTSGQGDVGFLTHINLLKALDDGKVSENDIELLCPEDTRAPVNQYENCNFGKVPPKLIITNNQKNDVEVDELRNALLSISNLYGAKSELFKLFGRYKKFNNLLFSNTANGLKLIEDISSQISNDFMDKLEGVNYRGCTSVAPYY